MGSKAREGAKAMSLAFVLLDFHEKDSATRAEGSSQTPEFDYANQLVKFKAIPFVLC